jgi:hypothetical protein
MPTHDDDGTTDAEQYINSLDRVLQPGDVAYDKNSGSWVMVVGIAAGSVRAYDDENGGRDLLTYAGNQLTACTLDDRVVSAVHLNKNTTKSAGSGSVYDFPEGRLTRFVHETADDDLKRVQDELREDMLVALLVAAKGVDERTNQGVLRAVKEAWGTEVKRDVQSIAQVEVGDKWGEAPDADDADQSDGDA